MPETRKKVFRSDRLRIIREQRALSQDDLAARLGFGASQMNRYENGKSEPSPDVLTRMSVELQVSTDWLLGLTDIPNDKIRMDDLSDREKALIESFRAADLESLMRSALEGLNAEHDHKTTRP